MLWGASCEGSSMSLGLVTNWQELQLCVLFLPGLFGAQTIKCLSVSWVLWIITVQGLSKKLAHLVLDKGASHQAPSSLSSGQSWSKAKGMALILKGFRICRPSCFAWALRMSCPSVPRRSVFSQQTLSHTCTLPSTIQFSRSVVSDSLWPRGLQHARLPCPSLTPGAYSNSCPLSRWCHPTISSHVLSWQLELLFWDISSDFLWPIILTCLVHSFCLVYLRILPCVRTHLLAKLDSAKETCG